MSFHQCLPHESEEPSSALLGHLWAGSLKIHHLFIKTNYVYESNFKQHRSVYVKTVPSQLKLLQKQPTLTFSYISSEIPPLIQLPTHSLQRWLLQAFFCVFSLLVPCLPVLPVTMLLYLTKLQCMSSVIANVPHPLKQGCSLLFKRPRGGVIVYFSEMERSFTPSSLLWLVWQWLILNFCGIYSYRI